MQDKINDFLRQDIGEASSLESSREALLSLAALCQKPQLSSQVQPLADSDDVKQQANKNNPTNANASP